jgi:hypothetical protein
MALFRNACRKSGSSRRRRKLCRPTHWAGAMPSQRVNAW